ncbi:hypothetical protein Unana1_01970 [Umbelopsis nana]
MSENNLFHFAQVVSEMPAQPHSTQDQSRADVRSVFSIRQKYGELCQCEESKPRRGKNLPKGYIDSRAKKLDRRDKEDYEFTLKWLNENAHPCYHDESGDVPEAHMIPEVALCKAHSSTLYRAKKKHLVDVSKVEAPPSPTDSTSVETPPPVSLTYEQVEQPQQFAQGVINSSLPPSDPYYSRKSLQNPIFRDGGLADRVRRLNPPSFQSNEEQPAPSIKPTATISASLKRKRAKQSVAEDEPFPRKTTSTPLKHGAQKPGPRNTVRFFEPPSQHNPSEPRLPHAQHSTQLPPLKPRRVRNLAISDTFTFRDILEEIEMNAPPPPGKRIVISDASNEIVFPMDLAIRSVIKDPPEPHVELCVGLADLPSIDWSS